MRHPGFVLALLPAALALLAMPVSCGNRDIDSICHQSCACSPCTRGDLEACLTKGDTAEATAQTKKCTEQLDALLSCLAENLSCQDGAGPGTSKCSIEETKLVACSGAGNPFSTPCEEATQKTNLCNGNTQPLTSSCPAVNACVSLCVLAQPCDVISGQTFSEPYNDCQNACTSTPPTGSGGFSEGSSGNGL